MNALIDVFKVSFKDNSKSVDAAVPTYPPVPQANIPHRQFIALS